MQSNLSVNNYRPSFGIKISKNFIQSAQNYYNRVEYKPWRIKIFDEKVDKYTTKYGFEDYTITYDKISKGGRTDHALYLTKDGEEPIQLVRENALRKVITRFMTLTSQDIEKIING